MKPAPTTATRSPATAVTVAADSSASALEVVIIVAIVVATGESGREVLPPVADREDCRVEVNEIFWALVGHLAAEQRRWRTWVPRLRHHPLLHEAPLEVDHQHRKRRTLRLLKVGLHVAQMSGLADT